MTGATPVPSQESVLCAFAAYLSGHEALKHRTIKVYLSAVRHLHISAALPDPFAAATPMNRLEYVMRGIKKDQAAKGEIQRERLPITPEILRKIRAVWEPEGRQPDIKMLWAACCVCFFAFLRIGEMTVPSDEGYDPAVHLSVQDVAMDDPRSPTLLQIKIKQSKTDPFRKGISLYVGRTFSVLCPVVAILDYLVVRGTAPGPLFKFSDGRLLTRTRFALAIRTALQKVGIAPLKYNTHSFRIGAATTPAAKGIEDSVIKTLGRWESLAYLQYVKIPRERLTGYSHVLVA